MALNDHQDIDDLFRDSLHTREKPPSPGVWDRIEGELDKDRRRNLFIWWLSSAGCLMFLLIGGFWYARSPDRNTAISTRRLSDRRLLAPPPQPFAAGVALPHLLVPADLLLVPADLLPAPANPLRHRPATPDTSPPLSPTTEANDNRRCSAAAFSLTPHFNESIGDSRFTMSITVRPVDHPSIIHRTPVRNRFDFTAYFSQELAGYSLADHDSTGPHGREIEEQEGTSFSTTAGIMGSLWLKGNWVIQSGLAYSRSISNSNPLAVVAVKTNNGTIAYRINTVTGYGFLAPNAGANVGDTAMTGKITSHLEYISIPLMISRAWTVKRFDFLAGGGFTTNWLTRSTLSTSVAGPAGDITAKEVFQYGLRKVNYSLIVKGECRYRLTRAYAVSLMTTFKNSVGPVNVHTSWSTYPYNLGVGLGLTRSF